MVEPLQSVRDWHSRLGNAAGVGHRSALIGGLSCLSVLDMVLLWRQRWAFGDGRVVARLRRVGHRGRHHGDYGHCFECRRTMGLALAARIFHENTPSWAHGGNHQYFSVATRLQAILDNTPLDNDSNPFWCFTACLLVRICRQREVSFDAPSMSCKALTRYLIERL
jgi:hypothetical protein